MKPWIRESKNEQLKQLLQKTPTEGRIREVERLIKELQLGSNYNTRIAIWIRTGPS